MADEISGSTIPNGSILAGAPSRLVYEIPSKEEYRALRGKVTIRDYEVTQCKFRVIGDGRLLWESGPLKNENKSVKPERFLIDISKAAILELVNEDIGLNEYTPYGIRISPEIGKH